MAELQALALAYTAWMAANHPEEISVLGDVQEGQIVVPVKKMKDRY